MYRPDNHATAMLKVKLQVLLDRIRKADVDE